MARKELSRNATLAVAVCWTVTTILWTVTTVLRVFWDYGDEWLWVVSALGVLASLAACVAWWYRYANYEKNQTETTQ